MVNLSGPTWYSRFWLVIAICTILPVLKAIKVCTIHHPGTLRAFNGDTLNVSLPCPFRMADFTCGDLRVQVVASSSVDNSGGYAADTMWVKVEDVSMGKEVTFMTSHDIFEKFAAEVISEPFETINGSYYDVLNVSVIHNTNTSYTVFLGRRTVFLLEVRTQPARVAIRCELEDFSAKPSPGTFCGDGTSSDSMQQAAQRVWGNDSHLTLPQFVHYTVMNDSTITNTFTNTCQEPASQFQTCPDQEEAARTCHVIFDDPSRVTCLLQSGIALEDFYSSCLRAVCDGDDSALLAMQNYVSALSNCTEIIEPICLPHSYNALEFRIVPTRRCSLLCILLGGGGSSAGVLHSMLPLDEDRLLLVFSDLKELRLVRLQSPNVTVSSLRILGTPQFVAQLSDNEVLVSLHDRNYLWIVTVTPGDDLRLDRRVRTTKVYVGVCTGSNNTFLASVEGEDSHTGRVDQLDLQGNVLRTVFNDTTGQYSQIFHLRRFGDHLYMFSQSGQLGILNLATGEVTTTVAETDLTTLGTILPVDASLDQNGEAYLCVGGQVCAGEIACVVHIQRCGQVRVLPTFPSRPGLICFDLRLTPTHILITWLDEEERYSEITVQRLPFAGGPSTAMESDDQATL